jgi:hypothetical protein
MAAVCLPRAWAGDLELHYSLGAIVVKNAARRFSCSGLSNYSIVYQRVNVNEREAFVASRYLELRLEGQFRHRHFG